MVGHEVVLVRPQGDAGAKTHCPDHLILVTHPIPVFGKSLVFDFTDRQILGLAVAPAGVVDAAQTENHRLGVGQILHFLLHVRKIGDHHLGQVNFRVRALEGGIADADFPGGPHIGVGGVQSENRLRFCLGVHQVQLLEIRQTAQQMELGIGHILHRQIGSGGLHKLVAQPDQEGNACLPAVALSLRKALGCPAADNDGGKLRQVGKLCHILPGKVRQLHEIRVLGVVQPAQSDEIGQFHVGKGLAQMRQVFIVRAALGVDGGQVRKAGQGQDIVFRQFCQRDFPGIAVDEPALERHVPQDITAGHTSLQRPVLGKTQILCPQVKAPGTFGVQVEIHHGVIHHHKAGSADGQQQKQNQDQSHKAFPLHKFLSSLVIWHIFSLCVLI